MATDHLANDDEGWEFGGFVYGLEPLLLPAVGDTDEPESGSAENHRDRLDQLVRLARTLPSAGGLVEPDPEDRYWFRWITGHQVCFVLWRLAGQLMEELTADRCAAQDVEASIACYIDGYSAMLLYTGSCPRDIYTEIIRPSMRRQHRAFSGLWAPDYEPVRDVMRGRPSALAGVDGDEIGRAVGLLQRVHDGIAAKLVDGGRSLLREATVRPPNHDHASLLYDSYFLTVRQRVSREVMLTQLLRRLLAIAEDLNRSGLGQDECCREAPELSEPDVLRAQQNLGDTLVRVAYAACPRARTAS